MTLSSLTPASASDPTSVTSHPITMPTVQDGDGAILAAACNTALTPTLSPEGGWTNPFTATVAALTTTGRNLHVWAATNLSAADSGKVLTIGTGATAVKMSRGIVPIRGCSVVDIIDAYDTKDGGTSNATTATTATLTTVAAGSGLLHVVMFRRNDGAAGDWFTSLEPDSGHGLTKDFSVFSSRADLATQFNALCIAHDWVALAAAASIPAYGYTADKAGTYYAVTLSIAALPEPEPEPPAVRRRAEFPFRLPASPLDLQR